jgi:hypothetical protein
MFGGCHAGHAREKALTETLASNDPLVFPPVTTKAAEATVITETTPKLIEAPRMILLNLLFMFFYFCI